MRSASMSSPERPALSLPLHEATKVATALEHMVAHLRALAEDPATAEAEATHAEMDLAFYEGLLDHVRRQVDEATARALRRR